MLKRIVALVTVLLLVVVTLTGCGGGKKDEAATEQPKNEAVEKTKVAFVYIGPVSDHGWTTAHDNGVKDLEQQVSNLEITRVENVPEGADAERVIEDLVQKGNKIIFTTSFGYMDPTLKVAKKYPDVTFLHCSGYKTNENMGTYFGRDYQARYLTGLVAGKATKTNTIGYVAAMPIPEVIRGINGFTMGVRAANPDAKVRVVWINSWLDPAKAKEAAKSLLEQGADVIAQHEDSPAPVQAAGDAGKLALGYNTDMTKFAPDSVLTGPVWNWGVYYVKTVQDILDGKWKSEQYWGGINDGIIDIGPLGKMVTDDTKTLVDAKKKEITDGKLEVFAGPLKDNTGKLMVQEGKSMTDDEMLQFNWYVEGVVGTIPSSK